jgi:amidophosphoribosyltransferase
MKPLSDSMHEECGVAGVFGNVDASRLVYLALHALQHRGQESAGIISSNGSGFHLHKGMGLVADVFNRKSLDGLTGEHAIGHVRYSTAGSSNVQNAQPIMVATANGRIAIAHNGNLTNALTLRKELEEKGSIFQTSSDSEVILHLFARSKSHTFVNMLLDALRQVEGAYSCVFITRKGIIVARDPWGVRPLALGKTGRTFVVASETNALDLIGAKYLREVEPGELITITDKGLQSHRISERKRKAMCVFEYIYFSRPDSQIFGGSVYKIRRELGRQLAREAPPPPGVDIVVPVPDSASVAAAGYAEEAHLPYELGLIRSHYIGRTFIEPRQAIRDFGAKIKYNTVTDALAGKKVILVDDSIVRGTTSRKLVRMIRKAGVKEVHMRISSPPITGPCFYGIDTPTKEELIASSHSVEEIRHYLGVESLAYLSMEGMLRATSQDTKNFCTACFSGDYRIKLEKQLEKALHKGALTPTLPLKGEGGRRPGEEKGKVE